MLSVTHTRREFIAGIVPSAGGMSNPENACVCIASVGLTWGRKLGKRFINLSLLILFFF